MPRAVGTGGGGAPALTTPMLATMIPSIPSQALGAPASSSREGDGPSHPWRAVSLERRQGCWMKIPWPLPLAEQPHPHPH